MAAETNQQLTRFNSGFAVVLMLFALLAAASHGNELLKQSVLLPAAEGISEADLDCREDELQEEGISLEECGLMLSSVRVALASSPDWYRSFQILNSSLGLALALASAGVAIRIYNNYEVRNFALLAFVGLIIVDLAGLLAAVNLGPLLRTQTLWPGIQWLVTHLCFLVALLAQESSPGQQASDEGSD